MQHTVIAFFDTYPQAEAARDALIAAGVTSENVTLKAKCEPTYASDATTAYESAPTTNEGLLASIERFFESLFETAPPEHERVQYAEAVRRGAVMVCVDAATDAIADLTRATLETMAPLDIEARASTWHPPIDEATRSHSPLEELGFKSSAPVPPTSRATVYSYARDTAVNPASGIAQATRPATEAAATAVAAGSAPGMGAVFAAGHGKPPAAQQDNAARPTTVPDEDLQDEETYHGDEPGPDLR
ncbi:hypothetical protein [Trinickia acidisoli]|uniref:hypothetical protein n=1 Tax=Trinickia acidisoli TaxID=2767482 RepID=UPI001A8C497A|nr:hypothetical protein [Trinickia acidisoli]